MDIIKSCNAEYKLPANIQAEQLLLGTILVNNNLLSEVSDFLEGKHFFIALHQKLYEAIVTLEHRGVSASSVTLSPLLQNDDCFIEMEGSKYLTQISAMAVAVISPYEYGRIIYDMAIQRSLVALGQEVIENICESNMKSSANEYMENIESQICKLNSHDNRRKNPAIKNVVAGTMKNINLAIESNNQNYCDYNKNEHINYVPSGFTEIDKIISGFQKSDLIIIAGRPSMGKTALAINFALKSCEFLVGNTGNNNSVNNTQRNNKYNNSYSDTKPKSVGFFSLEMSSEQISNRLLSMLSRIDSSNLRNGNINEEQYNVLRISASKLADMPLFIDDTAALSISAIRSRAKKLKRQHNMAILFIDYLQLIQSENKYGNRTLEITEITSGLKAIARELDIPVVVLSQLSRAVEQREDKRPVLSDLRDSGSIEQDADIVMFLYRQQYYLARKKPSPDSVKYNDWLNEFKASQNIAEVIIAKHRNGAIGNSRLNYYDKFSLVKNLS